MILKSITRWRDNWWADVEFDEKTNKVSGKLYSEEISASKEVFKFTHREKFTVSVKNNRFNVDIGTGSGVKVTFEIPS